MRFAQHPSREPALDTARIAGPIGRMRELFQTPEGLSYYDSAHMGLLPRQALKAGLDGLKRRAAPWEPSGAEATAEAVRASFAALIGASPETIALTPSTSYGMALATKLFPTHGQVLVLEDEHPSQIMAWRRATPIALRTVSRPTDGDWTQAILTAIDGSVAVACLPQCHWLDGAPIDLVVVSQALRSVGAILVVDATQSAGARGFDVDSVRPDILTASGYKWLLGPMGVGYLYLAPQHHGLTPLEDGFGPRSAPSGWFDAAGHVSYPADWKPGARRFDAAGLLNPIQLAIALEGLRLVERLGAREIQEELGRRNAALVATHANVPFRLIGAPTHILSVTIGRHERVREALMATAVSASLRGPCLRLSGHLWNDAKDAERVSELLRTLFG